MAIPRRKSRSKLAPGTTEVREHLEHLRNEVNEQLWCNWDADSRGMPVQASTLAGDACDFRIGAGATGLEVKERVAKLLGLKTREIDLVFTSGAVTDEELVLDVRLEELAGPPPQMSVLRKPVREALVGSECNLSVWDFEQSKSLETLRGHGDGIISLAVDWRARYALSGAHDCTLRLWDLDHNICVQTLQCEEHPAFCLALDVKRQQALTGSWDSDLKLWDLATAQCIRTFSGHTSMVKCLSVNWSRERAVSGSYDYSLMVWELGGSSAASLVLSGHEDRVLSVDVCWMSGRVASGSQDNTARLWDLADGRCFSVLRGHIGPVACLALSWESDRLLTGGHDGSLRLWDLSPLKAGAESGGAAVCIRVLGELPSLMCLAVDWQACHGLAGSGSRLWVIDVQSDEVTLRDEVNWTRVELQQPGTYGSLSIGATGTLSCLALKPTHTSCSG